MEINLNSLKKTARYAGLLYLLWVITGLYGLLYISPKLFVSVDTAVTANNILKNEFLFRTGTVNSLLSNTICVCLALTLYRLLKQVNDHRAKLMVALLILVVPVNFIMEAFNIASLMILKGGILNAFELSQRQDLALLFLKINDYTVFVLELFWGLWLIPFGQLVYKSRYIPSILGILLIINGIAYIIHCLTFLLLPDYRNLVSQFAMPFWILGEISITLWLLIKGVKNRIPINDPHVELLNS